MNRKPIAVVAGFLVLAAIIAGWPSGTQSSWEGAKAMAAALVPVLSAMFGAFLAVHGYEVREARALRRRQIEQMYRAGHAVVARLHHFQVASSPERAAAGDRVNEAMGDLSMYVRLYGGQNLNQRLNAITALMNQAVRPLGPPDPGLIKKAVAQIDEMSGILLSLSASQFQEEQLSSDRRSAPPRSAPADPRAAAESK